MWKWKKEEEVVIGSCWGVIKWVVGVVVVVACAAALWPWRPDVKMDELNVKRVKVHPVGADVWISMSVMVHNRDIYWLVVEEVDVGVKYRGKKMGHVEKKGWALKSWASAHVEGDLHCIGLPPAEVAHLLDDLAKGQVYFRTLVEVTGQFGFLYYRSALEFKD